MTGQQRADDRRTAGETPASYLLRWAALTVATGRQQGHPHDHDYRGFGHRRLKTLGPPPRTNASSANVLQLSTPDPLVSLR